MKRGREGKKNRRERKDKGGARKGGIKEERGRGRKRGKQGK